MTYSVSLTFSVVIEPHSIFSASRVVLTGVRRWAECLLLFVTQAASFSAPLRFKPVHAVRAVINPCSDLLASARFEMHLAV